MILDENSSHYHTLKMEICPYEITELETCTDSIRINSQNNDIILFKHFIPNHEYTMDRIKGVYEGGFKTWECSYDLVEYIDTCQEEIFKKKHDELNILELGCGSGLPGIYCQKYHKCNVHFQDYNQQVIEQLTIRNTKLNISNLDRNRYFSGSWKDCISIIPKHHYDLIISSETIYDADSYQSFHDMIIHSLKPQHGYILLACKRFYFGLNGSSDAFIHFIQEKNVLKLIKRTSMNSNGVEREIILLSLNQCLPFV